MQTMFALGTKFAPHPIKILIDLKIDIDRRARALYTRMGM